MEVHGEVINRNQDSIPGMGKTLKGKLEAGT
jgi:hypothetical protein